MVKLIRCFRLVQDLFPHVIAFNKTEYRIGSESEVFLMITVIQTITIKNTQLTQIRLKNQTDDTENC